MASVQMSEHVQTTSTNPTCASRILPNEVWLQVFEIAAKDDLEHLWNSARLVSHQFHDCIERAFCNQILSRFAIGLALPRRDPITGALKWLNHVPRTQLIFDFESLDKSHNYAVLKSPRTISEDAEDADPRSLEEMMLSNALPRERLIEALPWVFKKGNYAGGASMAILRRDISWCDERKAWTWKIQWRPLITEFYKNKIQIKSRRGVATSRRQSSRRLDASRYGATRNARLGSYN